MVKASCEMRASPYEHEEMEFLSTLCEKIRQDSSIILLYIQVHCFFSGFIWKSTVSYIFFFSLIFLSFPCSISPLCFCNIILNFTLQPIAITGGVPSGFTPDDSFPPTPTHEVANGTSVDEQNSSAGQKSQPKFPLVDALLNMCHSAVSTVNFIIRWYVYYIFMVTDSYTLSTSGTFWYLVFAPPGFSHLFYGSWLPCVSGQY